MKKVFENYYYLSFLIFLNTIFTFKSIAAEVDFMYASLVGFSAFFVYNFHPYFFRNTNFHIEKVKYGFGLSALIWLFLLSINFVNLQFYSVILLLFAGILCIGYFTSWFTFNLRSNYLTKPLTIGIVFGICTAAVPYLQSGYLFSESILLAIGRTFFIATLALIFDIGDILQDRLERTTTFPAKWGLNKAKYFAIFLLVIGGLIEMWGAWNFLIDLGGIVALGFTYLMTFIAIVYAKPERSWWYFEVFVDGMLALPILLILLL